MSGTRRLTKELRDFTAEPPPGCSGGPLSDDLFKWQAEISGPEDSPYAGGKFALTLDFPAEYPMRPPKATFLTKVYHPNINAEGGVCIDILKDAWSPSLTVGKILMSLQLLLTDANPETPLMPEIANQYKTDRAAFDESARKWTEKYAMEKGE